MKSKIIILAIISFVLSANGLLPAPDLSHGFSAAIAGETPGSSGISFHALKAQTKQFIGYYHSIKLTPEEEKIKENGLSSIPAPCCDNYSALTCCCTCNLARTIWGLSNYLIRERQYNTERLNKTVLEWLAFTNPRGYSGEACYKGRCGYPFNLDGCGGMKANKLIF